MAIILVQTTLAMDSNIPADAVVNTFHYEDTSGSPGSNTAAVQTAVQQFYTDITTYLSAALSSVTSAHQTQYYNLDDPIPRQPFDEFNFTNGGGSGSEPPELACCLSYRGLYASGVANARRRGRFYVGPLSTACIAPPVLALAFIQALADAGEDLFESINAITDVEAVVWSPTEGAATRITEVWVDNAVDIQRRRGIAASAREVRGVT